MLDNVMKGCSLFSWSY